MKFKLINSYNDRLVSDRDVVYLTHHTWDDWFEYETIFYVEYSDSNGKIHDFGSVKIGEKGLIGGKVKGEKIRMPNVPLEFIKLPDAFFSLGQDVDYYLKIKGMGDVLRKKILGGLNDICFRKKNYDIAINENVTSVSLLRDISLTSVEGEYRRLAKGNSELSPYFFTYYSPKNSNDENFNMSFEVIPESNPPTNIHVIVGRNGVGKTHLLNNMINALIHENSAQSNYGYFESKGKSQGSIFANIISVTFSAFDTSQPMDEIKIKTRDLKYSYIGLKNISKNGENPPPKTPEVLNKEFAVSIENCIKRSNTDRWKTAIKMLESDLIFKNSNVISLVDKSNNNRDIKKTAEELFNKFSSGHKIVLLTITKLIESIEEKSLVLIDEPEAHLHPPLLSTFIRVLSSLIIQRNGVVIIATHSPVVLQEVPKSSVWKLKRQGSIAQTERLQIETFGENVGLLTREVFGLEVTHSGFHKILADTVENCNNLREVLDSFNYELGMEGQAIAQSLLSSKNKNLF